MVESLHPVDKVLREIRECRGKDLDPTMRMVFWPAVFGWTLLGVWITTLKIRFEQLKEKQIDNVNSKKAISAYFLL